MKNIPDIKLGLISVSRDCFPVELSEKRRTAVAKASGDIYGVDKISYIQPKGLPYPTENPFACTL